MRKDFSLFTREVKPKRGKKKIIYYYYAWDENNKRHKYSTGQTNEEDARDYCVALKKANELIPKPGCRTKTKFIEKRLIFKNFADGFWDSKKSKFLETYKARGHNLTEGTLITRKQRTKDYIMPEFGEMPLTAITRKMVNDWVLRLYKEKSAEIANTCLAFLRMMLDYAIDEELLDINPCKLVKPVKYVAKEKGFFNLFETISVFHYYNRVLYWHDIDDKIRICCFIASLTGLRNGELLALTQRDLYEKYYKGLFLVDKSFSPYDGVKSPKNGKSREIPIIPELIDLLRRLGGKPDDFIFSDDGKKPFGKWKFFNSIGQVLKQIGIPKERNISFHSFRHFWNTYIVYNGVSEIAASNMLGHTIRQGVRKLYTHCDYTKEELERITELQRNIWNICNNVDWDLIYSNHCRREEQRMLETSVPNPMTISREDWMKL